MIGFGFSPWNVALQNVVSAVVALIENGDFSDGITGWVLGASTSQDTTGGVLTLTNDSSTVGRLLQEVDVVSGTTYRATVDVVAGGTAGTRFSIDSTAHAFSGDLVTATYAAGAGPQSSEFTATTNKAYLGIYINSVTPGALVKVDSVLLEVV